MPLKKWKKLSETQLFKNSWWSYRKDTTELPTGSRGEYHYVHTNGASMIVPVLGDGRIVLVKQYRYLNDMESLELPCGGVKEGRTYEQTAKEELREEGGFIAQNWTLAGQFNPYNGVTDEICKVYVAKELTEVPSQPDETEEFERFFLTPGEIDLRIAGGAIWDGMTIAAWTMAKPHII
jgi:ADP-ribose pyrophosphatase